MTDSGGRNRKLLVGMHDGVCAIRSSDGGNTWGQGNVTPLAHAAARLTVSTAAPKWGYLAAYESGVYRTEDGGESWRSLETYPSAYAHSVLMHPANPHEIYVGSEPAAVFRSQDGGETWEECNGFRAVPESSGWSFHGTRLSHVRDLRMAPNDEAHLYAGIEVGGVVHSRDGGASWQQLHGTDDDIHLVNVTPSSPSRVYIATAGGPYRSDDEGKRWELVGNGLQRHYTLHISAAPSDADVVLVSVSSNAGRQDPQFYRSSNGAANWHLIESVGSDDDMVVAIDWDSANPHRVYAGTEGGSIFCSEDKGESWEPLAIRLPAIAVSAMVVAPT